MPSHPRESSSCNGVSRSNLFVESGPDDDLRRAVVSPAAAAASARGFSAARQRGRGLVVPVVDAHPPRDATRGASEVARFMRRGPLLRTARRHVRRADGNTRRLLGWLAARPPGALSALFAVAALLLAVGWLGFSLRVAAGARDHAQQHRAAAAAFEQPRRWLDPLTAQPVRGGDASGADRRPQAAAVAARRARAVAHRRQQAPPARHRVIDDRTRQLLDYERFRR